MALQYRRVHILRESFNQRYGIVKGLFISGIAMAASNLAFAWIAIAGPKLSLYAFAIIVDGFTQAWSRCYGGIYIYALHRALVQPCFLPH